MVGRYTPAMSSALAARIDDLLSATDADAFSAALGGAAAAGGTAGPEEVRDALARLEQPLRRLAFAFGSEVALLAGSLAERSAEPTALLPVLADRAAEAMETAAAFAEMYRAEFGEPPDPQEQEHVTEVLQRAGELAAARGIGPERAELFVQAWYSTDDWVQPVLYLAQRSDVRAALPQRDRLAAAIEPLADTFGAAAWLGGLLDVLDDEPLIVLDRGFAGTGRGWRATIGGIGDNFQLHTLLADALIGTLPGRRPTAAEVAAARDGDPEPAGGIRGSFNLADAYGGWIWNEGKPADIPHLDGVRVVVLDAEPYERSWNAGRLYPAMVPTLEVTPLPADEAARWLGSVKPAAR